MQDPNDETLRMIQKCHLHFRKVLQAFEVHLRDVARTRCGVHDCHERVQGDLNIHDCLSTNRCRGCTR